MSSSEFFRSISLSPSPKMIHEFSSVIWYIIGRLTLLQMRRLRVYALCAEPICPTCSLPVLFHRLITDARLLLRSFESTVHFCLLHHPIVSFISVANSISPLKLHLDVNLQYICHALIDGCICCISVLQRTG